MNPNVDDRGGEVVGGQHATSASAATTLAPRKRTRSETDSEARDGTSGPSKQRQGGVSTTSKKGIGMEFDVFHGDEQGSETVLTPGSGLAHTLSPLSASTLASSTTPGTSSNSPVFLSSPGAMQIDRLVHAATAKSSPSTSAAGGAPTNVPSTTGLTLPSARARAIGAAPPHALPKSGTTAKPGSASPSDSNTLPKYRDGTADAVRPRPDGTADAVRLRPYSFSQASARTPSRSPSGTATPRAASIAPGAATPRTSSAAPSMRPGTVSVNPARSSTTGSSWWAGSPPAGGGAAESGTSGTRMGNSTGAVLVTTAAAATLAAPQPLVSAASSTPVPISPDANTTSTSASAPLTATASTATTTVTTTTGEVATVTSASASAAVPATPAVPTSYARHPQLPYVVVVNANLKTTVPFARPEQSETMGPGKGKLGLSVRARILHLLLGNVKDVAMPLEHFGKVHDRLRDVSEVLKLLSLPASATHDVLRAAAMFQHHAAACFLEGNTLGHLAPALDREVQAKLFRKTHFHVVVLTADLLLGVLPGKPATEHAAHLAKVCAEIGPFGSWKTAARMVHVEAADSEAVRAAGTWFRMHAGKSVANGKALDSK